MDINVLIICITVIVCVVFIMAAIAYVADRRRTRTDKAIEFIAQFVVAATQKAAEEVKGDE